MNIALILASGESNRYKNKTPKQFEFFDKKMIVEHSVNTFLKHPKIDKVILLVPKVYLKKLLS